MRSLLYWVLECSQTYIVLISWRDYVHLLIVDVIGAFVIPPALPNSVVISFATERISTIRYICKPYIYRSLNSLIRDIVTVKEELALWLYSA
jgi:hypothetical protein